MIRNHVDLYQRCSDGALAAENLIEEYRKGNPALAGNSGDTVRFDSMIGAHLSYLRNVMRRIEQGTTVSEGTRCIALGIGFFLSTARDRLWQVGRDPLTARQKSTNAEFLMLGEWALQETEAVMTPEELDRIVASHEAERILKLDRSKVIDAKAGHTPDFDQVFERMWADGPKRGQKWRAKAACAALSARDWQKLIDGWPVWLEWWKVMVESGESKYIKFMDRWVSQGLWMYRPDEYYKSSTVRRQKETGKALAPVPTYEGDMRLEKPDEEGIL